MKASEFLKRYEEKQKDKEERAAGKGEKAPGDQEEHSLQEQAKERAKHPEHLNVGTPFDWEELEDYQKELDRLDREGPGRDRPGQKRSGEGTTSKPSGPDKPGQSSRE